MYLVCQTLEDTKAEAINENLDPDDEEDMIYAYVIV